MAPSDPTDGPRPHQPQPDTTRRAKAGLDRPRRIAVTGATGMVGSRLVALLRAGGHDVVRLVRRPPTESDQIFWDPDTGQIDAAALEGIDAAVHLAGESIAGTSLLTARWTATRKERILTSRTQGTGLLARTLAQLPAPPRVLVSASGIGYYGDGGDAVLTESSPGGEGFLADVCRAWEAATEPAAAVGIRVVTPRFAVVLAGNGGMLARLAPLFRLGLGGRLGGGDQFFSWIALDDLVGLIHRAIVDESLVGPFNATAPHPVTNRDFTETLGRVLRRPTFLPAPAFALRLALRELADELLLISQRAVPARLTEAGFCFAFPTLEDALRHELDRPDVVRFAAEAESS